MQVMGFSGAFGSLHLYSDMSQKGSGIHVMLAGKPQSAIRWINRAFLRHVLGGALPGEHEQEFLPSL
jgi:hypothetical protein